MMPFLEDLIRVKLISGINLQFDGDEKLLLDTCMVRYSHGSLELERQQESLTDINDLKKTIPDQGFVTLNITGKQVLIKSLPLENAQDRSDSEILQMVIPNSKIEDFYIQTFEGASVLFLSVIRKSDADRWITLLKNYGFSVISLSLGPYVSSQLLLMLNIYESPFIFNGFRVELTEQMEWIGHQSGAAFRNEFALKIQHLELKEKMALPFAASLQVMMSDKFSLINAKVPEIDQHRDKLRMRAQLLLNSAIVGGVLFVLLLVNLFLLSHLNGENDLLAEKVQDQAQYNTLSNGQSEQLRVKQAQLKMLGWQDLSKSQLVDELASLLPVELTWMSCALAPIDEITMQRDHKERVLDRTITITGRSDNVIPVNEYLARIRTLKWVKQSHLVDYRYDQDQGRGIFKLLINY